MEKKRNINLDIIRCVAVFSVIAVHFFWNNEFYAETVVGKRMYCMVLLRNSLMICVPLFMLLTGYLMCNKELSKKYYKGIWKTIETYILASGCIWAFHKFYLGQNIGIKDGIYSTLQITPNGYSWYVEMYIGLYLFIPFLNVLYKGLKSQKEKILLIAILLGCTTLPTVFNIWGHDMIPDWWKLSFPILYYFIGSFIREYNPKIEITKNILILLVSFLLFGSFSFYRSHGGIFEWGLYNDWRGIQNVVNSVLVFLLLLQIKTEKIPEIVKKGIVKISELSFGMYLVSYIFDSIVYAKLNSFIPEMVMRMGWIVVTVPIVIVCSALLSQLFSLIIKFRKMIMKSVY